MANPEIDPATFTTLEISVPKQPSAEADMLIRMATNMGWPVRERQTLPSDLAPEPAPVPAAFTRGTFTSLSAELWGAERYGRTAQSFIDAEADTMRRLHDTRTFINASHGGVTVSSYLPAMYGPKNEKGLGSSRLDYYQGPQDTGRDMATINAALERLWPRTPYPFATPAIVSGDHSEPQAINWMLEPGPVTRERLAHFLRTSRLDRHETHGALGKALDVLNVSAGLTETAAALERAAAEPAYEFVDYKRLRAAAKASGLTRYAIDDIRSRIHMSLTGQSRHGRPSPYWPEVVVEGEVTVGIFPRTLFDVRFEQIAVESLEGLFAAGRGAKHKKPKAFLESFIAAERAARQMSPSGQ